MTTLKVLFSRNSRSSRAAKIALPLSAAALFALCVVVTPAFAAAKGPGWELTARTFPTNLPPGGKGLIRIDVFNVGAAASKGTITVTDTLPPGVTATEAGELSHMGIASAAGLKPQIGHRLWSCIGTTVVTCTNEPSGFSFAGGGGGVNRLQEASREGGPNFEPEIGIAVEVNNGQKEVMKGEAEAAPNRVAIAGGGALGPASTTDPVTISSTPAGFGVVGWDGWFSNADGTPDMQAGSHPYEATFSLDLATVPGEGLLEDAGAEFRDVEAQLPPGFVGNPTVVAQCTRQQLNESRCPASSQIGLLALSFTEGLFHLRVFNMVPPLGVPAEFGYTVDKINAFLDSTVRSGSDYGITTHANNTPRRAIVSADLTLWGNPADPSHDPWRTTRGGGCGQQEFEEEVGKIAEHGASLGCPPPVLRPVVKPFLTLPTACGRAQPFSVRVNSWKDSTYGEPVSFPTHDANDTPTGFTGCEFLGFGQVFTAAPDTSSADTPAGLTVDVKPSLGELESPEGLGSSDIEETKVTLPAGLVINPGQAAGLEACQESESGLGSENPSSCPLASKVGTVMVKSPLIEAAGEKEFGGDVFVLQSNPPNLKLLMAFSADGVNIKLVLNVHLDETTGRLTTTVPNIPELPASDFKLSFSGGAQAALDTPTQCGTYTTNADFTPWSSPFVADFPTSAAFAVTAGASGGPCPASPLPFAPSMVAGSTTDQAGGFTNFSLLLQRGDGQQRIERLRFREPAGLAGMISSVPLCPEPQAARGECSDVSKIGHAAVASGPGPYPLVIPQPGNPESPIFLTGPYGGAPFGLSIVTHVIAGPFNLGTIITRAKIEIDPHTAQITVTTDPFPQIVAGVPTDLRLINSVIDRPNFLFNPTNCTPQEFTGTAWGTPPPGAEGPGATAAISSHFGIGSCQSLKFKPKFSVSASGKNSKAGGASLNVTLAYPSEPQGSEANIAKVKVDLPKQLPSRLTTLQKACTAAQFDANPAGCPAASVVGHAVVHTPVLPVPLEGPAYFVSNGGEAFPNLIMVLQGYGITVDLVGDTFINKQGITSSTFKATPDVPFSTFQLTLPQGPHSALATDVPASAQYSLCGQKLSMPTELVAQNGAVIDQSTPVGISGCAKKKSLTRSEKLALALKACHKRHNHAKRAACERQARRKYGLGKSRRNAKKK